MGLIDTLRARVGAVAFPQLVRIGEQLAQQRGPGPVEVGGDVPPGEEAVHFTASDRMSLVASDIAEIGAAVGGGPLPVTTNLLGLAGATPALPPFYSEVQLQRRRLRDRSLASFTNIFDHRALSFFYRIFRKYNWVVSAERSAGSGDDPISRAVLALAGFATPSSRNRLGIDDAVLAPLAAQLGDQRRSAAAVETVLHALTGFDLQVLQAEPVWLAIPLSEQTRLGSPAMRRFSQLGSSSDAPELGSLDAAIIGAAVLDVQHHYVVAMGPLSHSELVSFCRDDGPARTVGEACLIAAGLEHQPILRLSIDAGDIPPLQLGSAATPALLARTAWLGSPGGAGTIMADCEIPIDRSQIAAGF
ncbi:type VI secretion system baseplate subunit TssG [Sandarakinorhabdus sp. DWP1-3-1]|uniref:type VI secretion system baseplate subunit TssG n=1 Tax=Sandarakinorhabdus sp. DWP1-3-1 TaxID=2804627 RepID=UPI003CF38AE6